MIKSLVKIHVFFSALHFSLFYEIYVHTLISELRNKIKSKISTRKGPKIFASQNIFFSFNNEFRRIQRAPHIENGS